VIFIQISGRCKSFIILLKNIKVVIVSYMGPCLSKNQKAKLIHCFTTYPISRFFFRACCCKYLCCFCCINANRNGATVKVNYDSRRGSTTEPVNENAVQTLNSTWAKLISIDDSQHIIVKDNICTLGRIDGVTNKINDPRISSQHCTIRRDGDIFFLKDDSTNGTFVNRKLVGKDKEVELNHGDEVALLSLGENKFYFSYLFQVISKKYENKTREKKDVFISYCWANKEQVYKIKQDLISNGFSVWLDIDEMQGGKWLYDEIVSGISNSSVFLSFCSPEYVESRNCGIEVSLAGDWKKKYYSYYDKKA